MRHSANIDPPNRFENRSIERVFDDVEWDDEYLRSLQNRRIEYIEDQSESIVACNSSPDLPFDFSLNPYRGCAGLNDSEIPDILRAASRAGAGAAGYILLRLPLTVQPVFEEWIRRTHPDKADMVLGRIKKTRGGRINDSTFGQRMTGTGEIADQIRTLFRVFKKKFGLDQRLPPHNCGDFQPPVLDTDQRRLF